MAIKLFYNKDVNHIMDEKPFQQSGLLNSFICSFRESDKLPTMRSITSMEHNQILTMNYEASSLYWIVICLDKILDQRWQFYWNNIIKWIFSYQQISTHFYDNFVWTLTIACLLSALYWHLPSYGYKDDSNRKQMKNSVWQPPAITKNAICWTQ